MTRPQQMFAVVPAAGLSRRMGQSKLLLNLAGVPIIERVLRALEHPAITNRRVVVRQTDLPLQAHVARLGATLAIPQTDPPDMRASVTLALEEIQNQFSPADDDGWLLAPADRPVLDQALIDQLMGHWQSTQAKILVPRCGARRGHPTLFRWSVAKLVPQIPADRSLNWLLRELATDVTELPVESQAVLTDLDTPEDYARLKARWES